MYLSVGTYIAKYAWCVSCGYDDVFGYFCAYLTTGFWHQIFRGFVASSSYFTCGGLLLFFGRIGANISWHFGSLGKCCGTGHIQSLGKLWFFCPLVLLAHLGNCHNPNENTTQPQHCSWVWHENDCVNPTPPSPHPQEPQINIYWPQLNTMWPVTTSRVTTTTLTTTTTKTTTKSTTTSTTNQQPLGASD